MSPATMALKNLSRQKRRSFLLGGAIAFGLMIITVINGLSGSLVSSLEANISNLVPGHIILRGAEKTANGRVIQTLGDSVKLQAAIDELQIPYNYLSKTTNIMSAGLVSDAGTTYVSVTGATLGEGSYLHDRLTIVQGDLNGFDDGENLLISEGMATKLNVQIGDRISVQSETVTGQQNVTDLYLKAVYKDPGVAAFLAGAYAPLAKVNELRGLQPQEFTTFGLYLKDVSSADEWGAKLYAKLGEANVALFDRGGMQDVQKAYRDQTWEGVKYSLMTLSDILAFLNNIFFYLNMIALGILVVLFVVIMVGIANTYRMVVYERTREIGTLRALGMQRNDVRNLFLYEAMFLGLGGIFSGFLLGVLVLAVLSLFDFSVFSNFSILLKDNHVALNIGWLWFLFNLAVVSGLTALAAYFPARRAGLLTPAEALRTTN